MVWCGLHAVVVSGMVRSTCAGSEWHGVVHMCW